MGEGYVGPLVIGGRVAEGRLRRPSGPRRRTSGRTAKDLAEDKRALLEVQARRLRSQGAGWRGSVTPR